MNDNGHMPTDRELLIRIHERQKAMDEKLDGHIEMSLETKLPERVARLETRQKLVLWIGGVAGTGALAKIQHWFGL
jgi:hypothetical protein